MSDLIKIITDSPLLQIIIVAVLGVMGNIAYFEYQTRKGASRDLVKLRLTNLLLPLYVALHIEEAAVEAWLRTRNGDYAESHAELPKRILHQIEKIIKENIYLADDKLHIACVNFLQWAYCSDTDARFQELMSGDFESAIRDKDFKKFYDIVTREYEDARHEYIKSKK